MDQRRYHQHRFETGRYPRGDKKLYGTRSPSKYHVQGGSYDAATLILIDMTGVVRWIYQNANYKIRAPISLDLAEARQLQ